MRKFGLYENGKIASILIEKESFEGIKLIGKTVAEDIECVTGKILHLYQGITGDGDRADSDIVDRGDENLDLSSEGHVENLILIATVGRSLLLDRLISEGKISVEDIAGKREVYKMSLVEAPFGDNTNIKKLLVIAGSDKRGTIYGMFRLSRMCGVSPLVFWGDAKPLQKDEVVLDFDEDIVSKEPSVKYRGFFINDEWPAFGNWCTEKYGDVNAKAYEKIFELLLRLNGNYMWPAMWNSSFSEDGPGLQSAEFADKLGVIMGTSHHEPMCRAGVEWQNQYRKYSDDNAWSFITNEAGISKFWEDGILRNKDFENVITIGMRGEADSKLMPEDATLKDNIEVVKKAIKAQNNILKEQFGADLQDVPRMIAIYKEVEDYYYGDDDTEGLKDWDELEDVIFLLSDDNHGHVRALPTADEAKHPGGFGMYYHFDYHGAPVSYEWANCNRLTKTWEQMSLAYETGVREMWIVNVGDLKLNEYPLSFFMEMAYDYEAHRDINKTEEFIRGWIDTQFGEGVTLEQKDEIFRVLEGYTRWNGTRTPETMNANVYNPVDFMEGDRVWEEVNATYELAKKLDAELSEPTLTTYRSMIFYPAAASLNIMLMNIEAGMNSELAQRGSVYANHYAKSVLERVADDKKYVADFHAFNGGKWNHMMSSAHTGFRTWDAYNWSYPPVSEVPPIHEAKAVVSFRGSRQLDLGSHWQGSPTLRSDGFTRPDTCCVLLDIDSRGDIGFTYSVEKSSEWLICDEPAGRVEDRKTVAFEINRDAVKGRQTATAKVKLQFDNGVVSESSLEFEAVGNVSDLKYEIEEGSSTPNTASEDAKQGVTDDKKGIFIENQGLIAIEADHFAVKKDCGESGFRIIRYLGKAGRSAVKAFPAAVSYDEAQIQSGKTPCITYRFIAKESGVYDLIFHCSMRNPIVRGGRLNFGYAVDDGDVRIAHILQEGYFTEWQCDEWGDGVLAHEHLVKFKTELQKGLNTISVYAGDANFILEKLVMHREKCELADSYLGPVASPML